MQRIFLGLPSGIPGIGLDIEGAMQHAPHFLQFTIKPKFDYYNLRFMFTNSIILSIPALNSSNDLATFILI